MKRERVTLRDVAQRAGVSIGAASVALSGRPGVSEATRGRVKAAADELGYVANVGARNLRRGSAGAIGVYLPEHATNLAFYMEMVFGVLDVLKEHGHSLTLIGGCPNAAASAHIDGAILIDVHDGDPVAASILGSRTPAVSIEELPEGVPGEAQGVVSTTVPEATRDILLHMRDSGARRPALFAPGVRSTRGRMLRDGLARFTAETGTEVRIVELPKVSSEELVAFAEEFFRGNPDVDAVLVAPDGPMPSIRAAASRVGRVVGEDLMLATCVDGVANRASPSPVTSLDLQSRALGAAAAELIERIVASDDELSDAERRTVVPVELRLRASTAPLTRAPHAAG